MIEQAARHPLGRMCLGLLSCIGVLGLISGVWVWREYFPDHLFLDHSHVYYDVSTLVQPERGVTPAYRSTTALAADLTERLHDCGPHLVLGLTDRPVILAYGDFLQQHRLREVLQALEHP